MAAIELEYPHMVVCQISDNQMYTSTLTKVNVLDPVEVVIPHTMYDRVNGTDKLHSLMKEKFPHLNITPVLRTHFNGAAGLERIQLHCTKECSIMESIVQQKYYALAAVAALLKYVEYSQHIVYVPRSMRIEYQGAPGTAVIDFDSAQNLELVVSQCRKGRASLLSSMDHCSTPMGRKLLRASILQPLCNKHSIIERQSSVAELLSDSSLCGIIQPVIRKLFGVDRLLSFTMQPIQSDTIRAAERTLNYILLLKDCLDVVPELKAALTSGKSALFQKVCNNLDNPGFQLMKEEIMKIIHPEAKSVTGYTSSNMQRCFAVKVGLNDLLDIARQTYCELIDDMKSMVEQLADKYKMGIVLACDAVLGYHIQMDAPKRRNFKLSDLPDEFIGVQKKRNTLTMTTDSLLVLDRQCRTACDELHIMSNVLLDSLLANLKEHIGCLFQLGSDVAELDLIISLARVSSAPSYVRPTFGSRLKLENATHPVMEMLGIERPVANNVEASAAYNFHTITGPNMSGKSVYLKKIVLLHIMAQVGCYVPASKAEFRITDRIFCKMCSRDSIEFNTSTYISEMKEVQHILQSVTAESLVVLDELCRSSSVDEGSSLAWAICTQLLLTSAFTFSTTHFLLLTKLADLYHNVTNHCFEIVTRVVDEDTEPRLVYTHKLTTGVGSTNNYGIVLAELCHLPQSITTEARRYAIDEEKNDKFPNNHALEPVSWGKKCYDCVAEMYSLLETEQFKAENIIEIVKKLDRPKQTGNNLNGAKEEICFAKLRETAKDIVHIETVNASAQNEIISAIDNDERTLNIIRRSDSTNVNGINRELVLDTSSAVHESLPCVTMSSSDDIQEHRARQRANEIHENITLTTAQRENPTKCISSGQYQYASPTNIELNLSKQSSASTAIGKLADTNVTRLKSTLKQKDSFKGKLKNAQSNRDSQCRRASMNRTNREAFESTAKTILFQEVLLPSTSKCTLQSTLQDRVMISGSQRTFMSADRDVSLKGKFSQNKLATTKTNNIQSLCSPIPSNSSSLCNCGELDSTQSVTDVKRRRLHPDSFAQTRDWTQRSKDLQDFDIRMESFKTTSVMSDMILFDESSQKSPNKSVVTISQMSTISDVARMAARRKEADIFRQIEGENFNEKEFFTFTPLSQFKKPRNHDENK